MMGHCHFLLILMAVLKLSSLTSAQEVVQFQFSPSYQLVSEDSGAVLVCVELLSGTLTENLLMGLTPQPGSADNTDFGGTSQTVQFPAGSTAQERHCASFPIVDDATLEVDEHFIVRASREDLFSNSTATIVIQDNDAAVRFKFSAPSYQTFENDSSVQVCVVQTSGITSQSLTITLNPTPGSANVSDFETALTTVSFPLRSGPNMTRCTPIQIFDDFIVESKESFTVTASGGEFSPQSQVSVVIMDNDIALLELETPTSVSEADGVAVVDLQLFTSDVTSAPIRLFITTSSGRATAGVDFRTRNALGEFRQNSSPGNQIRFDIEIIDDDISEPTEEFVVTYTLLSPQSVAMAMFPGGRLSSNATVFIIDNDVYESPDPCIDESVFGQACFICGTCAASTEAPPELEGTTASRSEVTTASRSEVTTASRSEVTSSERTLNSAQTNTTAIISSFMTAIISALLVAIFIIVTWKLWPLIRSKIRKLDSENATDTANATVPAVKPNFLLRYQEGTNDIAEDPYEYIDNNEVTATCADHLPKDAVQGRSGLADSSPYYYTDMNADQQKEQYEYIDNTEEITRRAGHPMKDAVQGRSDLTESSPYYYTDMNADQQKEEYEYFDNTEEIAGSGGYDHLPQNGSEVQGRSGLAENAAQHKEQYEYVDNTARRAGHPLKDEVQGRSGVTESSLYYTDMNAGQHKESTV